MKKMKTITIITIFLLTVLCLNPITLSNKINEDIQNNDILDNPSTPEINDINTLSIKEKILQILKNYLLTKITSEIAGDINIDEIMNYVNNALDANPSLLRKTLVISQGWNYDINFLKNTRLQLKRDLFYFWHYTQASKTGAESKTFIIRANDLITSSAIELYKGKQTGIMLRPFGLYYFQKNTVPMLSYTLFIGFASYVYTNAEETVILNNPLK